MPNAAYIYSGKAMLIKINDQVCFNPEFVVGTRREDYEMFTTEGPPAKIVSFYVLLTGNHMIHLENNKDIETFWEKYNAHFRATPMTR